MNFSIKLLTISFYLLLPTLSLAQSYSGSIEGVKMNIVIGDVSKQGTEAVIVPHFKGEVSTGGVGGAIIRTGGGDAFKEAQQIMNRDQAMREFGAAFLTKSTGTNSNIINIVSVGSGEDKEYATIRQSVLNGLKVAEKNGIKSVSVPALGTGIIGQLTNEQSAHAIMSAVAEFRRDGGKINEINIVIYGDKAQHKDFVSAYDRKTYAVNLNAARTSGERAIDPDRWAKAMAKDGDGRYAAPAQVEQAVVRAATEPNPAPTIRQRVGAFFKGFRGSK
ncbi:MAG: hypothetical protein A4S09_16950 [Proteobacteria bacterium SG_bin7]|nr:MAG: hypothetical protein A4S09_16950 [Proteobacteria bacterium SG_bin7]